MRTLTAPQWYSNLEGERGHSKISIIRMGSLHLTIRPICHSIACHGTAATNQYDDALYHVTSRGNDHKAIAKDDSDRELFLNTLARVTDGCTGFASRPRVAGRGSGL